MSLDELTGAFGIQTHSAHAYISVESRKAGKKAALRDGRYYIN